MRVIIAAAVFALLTCAAVSGTGLAIGLGWLADGADRMSAFGRTARVVLSALAVTAPAGILWTLLSWTLNRAKAKRPHVDFFVAAFAAPVFMFFMPGVDRGRLPDDHLLILAFIVSFVAAAFVYWLIAEHAR